MPQQGSVSDFWKLCGVSMIDRRKAADFEEREVCATRSKGSRTKAIVFSEIKAASASAFPPKVTLRLLAATHYFAGEPELRQIARLVDPEKQSIDVGAHHGVYTYFLARHTRWVHCYEPYPKDAKFLAEAFARRNVTVYPFAVSDQEGAAELYVPLGPGNETNGQPSLLAPRGASCPETRLSVTTKRLDQMGHANVGFIKVDVEGHERAVVAGAAKLLEEQRPLLLVELHGYTDEDPVRLLQEIKAPDYTGWFYSSRQWVALERFRTGLHSQLEDAGARGLCYRKNLLFVPKERQNLAHGASRGIDAHSPHPVPLPPGEGRGEGTWFPGLTPGAKILRPWRGSQAQRGFFNTGQAQGQSRPGLTVVTHCATANFRS